MEKHGADLSIWKAALLGCGRRAENREAKKTLPYLVKAALGARQGLDGNRGGRESSPCGVLDRSDISFARALQMCQGMDGSGGGRKSG